MRRFITGFLWTLAMLVLAVPLMPAAAHAATFAQDTVVTAPAPSAPWWVQVLVLLTVPIVGLLSKFGWDGVEKIIAIVKDPNKINPMLKPFLVLVVAFVIGQLAGFLNITLPGDITAWTPDTVYTLASGVFAILIHLAQKNQEKKVALAAQGVAVPK